MVRSRLVGAFAVVLALAAASFVLALTIGEGAPPFDLKDQFGEPWKSADLKGKVAVVVVANPDSGRAMGPWVDNLKGKYANKIALVGLMDLHTVPGIGRGIAKSRIKRETSDPLMLDFKGDISKAYLVNDKLAVVVVIDKSGVVRLIQQNAYSEETFGAVVKAIDKEL